MTRQVDCSIQALLENLIWAVEAPQLHRTDTDPSQTALAQQGRVCHQSAHR